jgi:hypothetical protein
MFTPSGFNPSPITVTWSLLIPLQIHGNKIGAKRGKLFICIQDQKVQIAFSVISYGEML